jgi:hypothetical protein
MLGEKLGELRGKVTGQRVLPSDGPNPKVETSFEISGPLLSADATMLGTYWSVVRADGSLYGECPQQGVILTRDGGRGTWTGGGVGRFTGQGMAVSFRGAIYFQTVSQPLARLAQTAVIYEWDVEADGNARAAFWEWK